MVHCIAFGCNNSNDDLKLGISFFRLPKDVKLRAVWHSKLQRQDPPDSDHVRVCSDHFTTDCFEDDMQAAMGFKKRPRRQLKKGAFPTLFGFSKLHIATCRETSKRRAENTDRKQLLENILKESFLRPSKEELQIIKHFKDGRLSKEHPDFVPTDRQTVKVVGKSLKRQSNKKGASFSNNQSKKSEGTEDGAPTLSQPPDPNASQYDPNSQTTCQFYGCTSDLVKHPDMSFFLLPNCAGAHRDHWLRAMNWQQSFGGANAELTEKDPWASYAVCSLHFITGLPSKDHAHPDHVPTVYPRELTPSSRSQQLSDIEPEFLIRLDHTYSTDARFIQCHPSDLSCPSAHSECTCTSQQPCPRAMAWVLASELPDITQECLTAILSHEKSDRQSPVFTYQSTNSPLKSMTSEFIHSRKRLVAVVGNMLSTHLFPGRPLTEIPNLEYSSICDNAETLEVKPEVIQWRSSCDNITRPDIKQEVMDVEDNDLKRSSNGVCQWEFKDGRLIPKGQ